MTGRIIQFGTSRFLQAHVDLFVHEARVAGQAIGPITVVKTTPGHDRSGRVPALKRGIPYPVRIRGVSAGRAVDELVEVASVDQAFDAQAEWPAVVRCFAREADLAVSNVGESGYGLQADDLVHDFSSRSPPRSFPAKLLALLLARFQEGGEPLVMFPTELVSGNGRRLGGIVRDLAGETRQPERFRSWLSDSVHFADTLVDRIVSEPIDPVGAVAEPYALWAIRRGGFAEPFRHPAVRMVADLEPFARLKLHILNLGHSVLADLWLRNGRAADETVRAILTDPAVFRRLMAIYDEEVMPGFALRGMGSEAEAYRTATLERFENPFLDHRLSDIAQNHGLKTQSRIGAFLDWVHERQPGFAAPHLARLLNRPLPS